MWSPVPRGARGERHQNRHFVVLAAAGARWFDSTASTPILAARRDANDVEGCSENLLGKEAFRVWKEPW